MGLSVFELMESYNISFEEAQILQFKIIGIMTLIILVLYTIQILLKHLNIFANLLFPTWLR